MLRNKQTAKKDLKNYYTVKKPPKGLALIIKYEIIL